MKIDGAIITEQGVDFAVVVVKSHVTQTDSSIQEMVEALRTIRDFRDLPIVLATQDSQGVFEYVGESDLVNFLASIDAARIPWMEYTIEEI